MDNTGEIILLGWATAQPVVENVVEDSVYMHF